MNVLQNVILGISLAAPIGPASMVIIRNALKHGFLGGVATALGVVLADTTYLLIVYFGLSSFVGIPLVKMGLWIFGMLVLCYLGFQSIKDYMKTKGLQLSKEKSRSNLFFSGYGVNISNPLAIVFWSGIYGSILASINSQDSRITNLLLSLTIIVGILAWHIFLSFVTAKSNKLLVGKFFKLIPLISGLILIFYGLKFGLNAFSLLTK